MKRSRVSKPGLIHLPPESDSHAETWSRTTASRSTCVRSAPKRLTQTHRSVSPPDGASHPLARPRGRQGNPLHYGVHIPRISPKSASRVKPEQARIIAPSCRCARCSLRKSTKPTSPLFGRSENDTRRRHSRHVETTKAASESFLAPTSNQTAKTARLK